MKIWAIANQKGGVGKTTTVISLGGLLATKGQRVLAIDLDPHGSLSSYLNISDNEGVYHFFSQANIEFDNISRFIVKTKFALLDIIPAALSLATLDRELGKSPGMGLRLKNSLCCLEPFYDFILLDCPPVVGILMINAIAACDMLMIPVQTEYLAIRGLKQMMATVKMVERSKNKAIHHIIIPTLFDGRTKASHNALDTIRELFPHAVWPYVIPQDTKFRDASVEGVPPSLYFPTAKGVWAYSSLLKAILLKSLTVSDKCVV